MSSANNVIGVSWTELKNFIANKNISLQAVKANGGWYVNAVEYSLIVQAFIPIEDPANVDQEDFETNYLPNANKNLGNRILGDDGAHSVDIILDGGVRKLAAQADVTINSLRGFDPIADTWFFIGTELNSLGAGDIGDTVRVQIAAGDNPSIYPAVDVTSTLTATEAGDETALANLIVSDLNNNSNFSERFFARRLDDVATTVYITSRQPGPGDERPNPNDFQVSSTGTTVVSPAFDNIIRRQKNSSLARDPANPILGVLGISGSVTASEGNIDGRIVEYALNSGSSDLRVDGSITPQNFRIEASPNKERFITSLRFEALGNGIQFTNFLSQNGPLNNGVLLTIRSNNSQVTFPAIQTTEDFFSLFSRGHSDNDLYDVAGTDYFRATLTFPAPFQLHKQDTFNTDDFIEVTVQDDLSSNLVRFRFICFGFEREF